jgi:hypothetical protein
MDLEVSIVLSKERCNYRKVAQEWYGLTDEQMEGMDVHHNPARHEGGRNIPEHLYVYHNTLHAAVHEDDFVLWSRVGGALGAAAVHKDKDEFGRSLHSLQVHKNRDEFGRSLLGIKNAERLHNKKDELGRSVHGVESAEKLHKEKNEQGKSVNAVKGSKKAHEKKDEFGRSALGVKNAKRLNSEKDESGKSVNAVKGGVAGAKAIQELGVGIYLKENQVKGGLVTGPMPVWNNGEKQIKSWDHPGEGWVRGNIPHKNSLLTMSYRYQDPDHPELGAKPAPVLVRMQKSRGYPHGPENRVRVE